MSFLNNIIDRAIDNKYIMVDDNAPPSCFTRYLSSMMMDYCCICQVGSPTNFYIPSNMTHEGIYDRLCGVSIIKYDGLLDDGDLLQYFLSKFSGDWNYDYGLVLATSHVSGLLGIIKK